MLAQIDASWRAVLEPHQIQLQSIVASLRDTAITPPFERVFEVLKYPISHYRAVIVGQDPYPTPGYATGLAFSVAPTVKKLPPSLKNIFQEYVADTSFPQPSTGDLQQWAVAGVALVNYSLTLDLSDPKAHLTIGWPAITSAILATLAKDDAVAILWGRYAQEVGSVFPAANRIESVHPSPLAAYRGFFGSRPFTKCNIRLLELGKMPIDWQLP